MGLPGPGAVRNNTVTLGLLEPKSQATCRGLPLLFVMINLVIYIVYFIAELEKMLNTELNIDECMNSGGYPQ